MLFLGFFFFWTKIVLFSKYAFLHNLVCPSLVFVAVCGQKVVLLLHVVLLCSCYFDMIVFDFASLCGSFACIVYRSSTIDLEYNSEAKFISLWNSHPKKYYGHSQNLFKLQGFLLLIGNGYCLHFSVFEIRCLSL